MDDRFFDAVLEYLILSADIEIVKKVLFPFGDFVLFVDEVVHILKVLVNV